MPRLSTVVGVAAAALALAAAALSPASVQAASPHADSHNTAGHRAAVDSGFLFELNDSGVFGGVVVVDRGGKLRVSLAAIGVERTRVHLSHIHGFGDGTQARCPDDSLAGDDGILTFAEGLPAYGPPVVVLGADPTKRSHLAYSRTFAETASGDPVESLGALDQYVVVVHGMTVDGTFEPTLPIACAVLR